MTDHQVKCLLRHYGQTGNIEFAALKSGMTRKTASKYIRNGILPSEIDQVRDWRTREDPLEKIWIEAEAFLLDSPGLESKPLLEHLIEKHPDQINQSHLRTFQRRVKSWRLKSGSKQEVFFDQNRKPGECMELDWTDMNALEIIGNKHIFPEICFTTFTKNGVSVIRNRVRERFFSSSSENSTSFCG